MVWSPGIPSPVPGLGVAVDISLPAAGPSLWHPGTSGRVGVSGPGATRLFPPAAVASPPWAFFFFRAVLKSREIRYGICCSNSDKVWHKQCPGWEMKKLVGPTPQLLPRRICRGQVGPHHAALSPISVPVPHPCPCPHRMSHRAGAVSSQAHGERLCPWKLC